MRSADAAAGVTVEIFVEQHVILEMRIGREFGMILQNRPLAVCAFEK